MNITHLDDLTYDYTQIEDPNARLLAKLAAQDIKPRLRRAAADIIAIGGKLATVREHLDHGQWLPWLETEFDMAERTARNFVQVARRFDGKSAIIADLGPTALYMLAAPSTPDEAIAEVESLVTNGHTPTVAETKQIINTVRAGLVPAPVVPAPGKLLVDWTDEDWAAHDAKIEAAVLEVADVPAAQSATAPTITGFERVKIAKAWLSDYRSKDGLGWRELTDTQITHANSPCYQEFCKANPGIYQPKIVLSSALFDLRRADRKGSRVPADLAPTPTPADSELNHWRCLRCKYVSATAGNCPRCGSGSWAVVSPTLAVSPSDDKNDLSPQNPPAPSPAPSSMAVHFTSESEEHYTPDVVWQAAKRVMGTIYLDPCSNSHERPNIPALRHYTIAEDGLRQYWEGSVFLNPPYGRQIGEWVGKLVEAHKTFDVPQAIALLPARVDTQWWQLIRDYPVCFVTGRLKFKGNDDNPAPFPSAIVYLGQRVGDFVREFSPMGDIWRRVQ